MKIYQIIHIKIVIFVTQLIHLKIFENLENLQLIICKLIINYVFAHGFHLPYISVKWEWTYETSCLHWECGPGWVRWGRGVKLLWCNIPSISIGASRPLRPVGQNHQRRCSARPGAVPVTTEIVRHLLWVCWHTHSRLNSVQSNN